MDFARRQQSLMLSVVVAYHLPVGRPAECQVCRFLECSHHVEAVPLIHDYDPAIIWPDRPLDFPSEWSMGSRGLVTRAPVT